MRVSRTGLEEDKLASAFWIKILAVFFAIGVATEIPMKLAFGTNWGEFSR